MEGADTSACDPLATAQTGFGDLIGIKVLSRLEGDVDDAAQVLELRWPVRFSQSISTPFSTHRFFLFPIVQNLSFAFPRL